MFIKTRMYLSTITLIFVLTTVISTSALIPKSVYNKTKNIIPDYYIKELRPPTVMGKPIEVDFSMRVMDINSINVEDMDFRMDMFLIQKWTDARIKIPEELFEYGDDSITLPSQFFENLWQPDLYFLNSKVVEIATLTHKFSSVTLYRNKTIRYAARMHAIVACQMEFQHYPMDTQMCPINIESFSYNQEKMFLKWGEFGVTVSPELKLLQYNILPIELEETFAYTGEKNGNFSRLVVTFRFERQIGHHLIQTFAPSTLVVALSWFSFWLGLDAIPGRMTLLVTCLLTLVTMFTGLRSDIPAVAYVKALDLWMALCMISVFAALGEFIIVKVLDGKYQARKNKERNMAMENAITPWTGNKKHSIQISEENFVKLHWKSSNGKEKVLWKEIDRFSRMIFPGLFFLISILYWTILIFSRSPIMY
ncbi:glycine receptor subunit alpha-2 [Aethina tumida]|uniref:glycine receptor subunit alpha-2 n=1 Tax=Aethina tumida TaxID=116153 RepID=UPI00096B26EE|nr:glycine receptor subunit alpha-2 [Aethina tumida]